MQRPSSERLAFCRLKAHEPTTATSTKMPNGTAWTGPARAEVPANAFFGNQLVYVFGSWLCRLFLFQIPRLYFYKEDYSTGRAPKFPCDAPSRSRREWSVSSSRLWSRNTRTSGWDGPNAWWHEWWKAINFWTIGANQGSKQVLILLDRKNTEIWAVLISDKRRQCDSPFLAVYWAKRLGQDVSSCSFLLKSPSESKSNFLIKCREILDFFFCGQWLILPL